MKYAIIISFVLFLIALIFTLVSPSSEEQYPVVFTQPEACEAPPSFITSKCPFDMVEVNGEYCPNIEEVCLKWRDKEVPKGQHPICLEFKQPTKCLSPMIHKHFCIDKMHWPNKEGEKPQIFTTWNKASDLCASIGKRLCYSNEFETACRGPEQKPYPYGYARNSSICNIDRKPWMDPNVYKFEELDRRVPSGSNPNCKSDYGVIDPVGNADNWVINETGKPYKSALMGGHYVQGARNQCGKRTLVHNEEFSNYEVSFRCCMDVQ